MPEKYEGPKFETVFLSKKIPVTKKSNELISWFRKLYLIGLAPEYKNGSSGNLSFRHKDGFVIKSTQTYFKNIKAHDLVFVKNFDLKNKIAYVYGKRTPSTELQMHYLIYKNKKKVNAVFHVHDYKTMKIARKHKIPITKVTETGTEKIGYDVLSKLNIGNFVIMKNHGVVSVGGSMSEAGNTILKWNKTARTKN